MKAYEFAIGDDIFHVLVYQAGGLFVAHCLDMDLVAQGNSEEEALKELKELVRERIQFATERKWERYLYYKSAPDKYWAMYWKLRKEKTKEV